MQITSAYDAGLVHKTGDELIGGAKTFTQAVQAAGVISSFDFSVLGPNQSTSVVSVSNALTGERVSLGVLSDENEKKQVMVEFIQRGVSNNIVMDDSGKLGTPFAGDKTQIDPFVLQSEVQKNLKTYIETADNQGSIEVNLSTSDGLFINNTLTDSVAVDFEGDIFAKDYVIFVKNHTENIVVNKTGVTFYKGSTTSVDDFLLNATNVATEIVLKFVSSTVCFVSVNT